MTCTSRVEARRSNKAVNLTRSALATDAAALAAWRCVRRTICASKYLP